MAEVQTYTGGCHCGAVRFQVAMKVEGGIACNCSICSKSATLLAFAPASQLQLLSGGDQLTDYQFGKKRIHHLFCARCGIRSFGRGTMPDGTPVVAVNLRCLDGLDVAKVPVQAYDGRSIPIDG